MPISAKLYNSLNGQRCIKDSIRNFMAVRACVRVRKAEIKLQCLNSDMELKRCPGLKWKYVDKRCIKRSHYCLDNASDYLEHLFLKAPIHKEWNFLVEF
jgi:hypothetical protein